MGCGASSAAPPAKAESGEAFEPAVPSPASSPKKPEPEAAPTPPTPAPPKPEPEAAVADVLPEPEAPAEAPAGMASLEAAPEIAGAQAAEEPPKEKTLRELFDVIDADANGTISKTELSRLLSDASNQFAEAVKVKLEAAGGSREYVMAQLDVDGDGTVTWAEFEAMLAAEPTEEGFAEMARAGAQMREMRAMAAGDDDAAAES